MQLLNGTFTAAHLKILVVKFDFRSELEVDCGEHFVFLKNIYSTFIVQVLFHFQLDAATETQTT